MSQQTNTMATSDWVSATRGMVIVSYIPVGSIEVANVPMPLVGEQTTKSQETIATEVSATA